MSRMSGGQPEHHRNNPAPSQLDRAAMDERGVSTLPAASHLRGTINFPIDLTLDEESGGDVRSARTWQPDSEASSCFICGLRFSLLYRRHHCRICGRVVCGQCSPNRMVVPTSIVVKPSSEPSTYDALHTKIEVRACNECALGDSRPERHHREVDATHLENQPAASNFRTSVLNENAQFRLLPDSSPHLQYSRITPRIHPSSSYRSSPSSPHSARNLSQPHPSENSTMLMGGGSRALTETDFCPICAFQLPPPDPLTGSEARREEHIQECIRRAEFRDASNQFISGSSVESGVNPHSSGKSRPGVAVASRRPRMVTYELTANERGISDGSSECVICFEEFTIGDSIARLDCFCLYHQGCILSWFNKKGNHDCPVHSARS